MCARSLLAPNELEGWKAFFEKDLKRKQFMAEEQVVVTLLCEESEISIKFN